MRARFGPRAPTIATMEASALVTGGASGLGAATAARLAAEGLAVTRLDRAAGDGVFARRRHAAGRPDRRGRGRRRDGAAARLRHVCRHRHRRPRDRARRRRVPAHDRGQPDRHVQHAPRRRHGDGRERAGCRGPARRDRAHRLDRRLRGPDRPDRLQRVQGRRRGHGPARRARPGAHRHPRRRASRPACSTRRCWPDCPSPPASRSGRRCRTRPAWAGRTSSPTWCGRSCATRW